MTLKCISINFLVCSLNFISNQFLFGCKLETRKLPLPGTQDAKCYKISTYAVIEAFLTCFFSQERRAKNNTGGFSLCFQFSPSLCSPVSQAVKTLIGLFKWGTIWVCLIKAEAFFPKCFQRLLCRKTHKKLQKFSRHIFRPFSRPLF